MANNFSPSLADLAAAIGLEPDPWADFARQWAQVVLGPGEWTPEVLGPGSWGPIVLGPGNWAPQAPGPGRWGPIALAPGSWGPIVLGAGSPAPARQQDHAAPESHASGGFLAELLGHIASSQHY